MLRRRDLIPLAGTRLEVVEDVLKVGGAGPVARCDLRTSPHGDDASAASQMAMQTIATVSPH